MDLSGVVLLFDEMDALVQKRDSDTAALDTESKFLTTYMLPKLAKLHRRGQIIFLMATNFQASFDDAIKRAGRFDFLICMGPPTLRSKCDAVHRFFGLEEARESTLQAGQIIDRFAEGDPWVSDQLSLLTYDEFGSFLGEIGTVETIGEKLRRYKPAKFLNRVQLTGQSVGLKMGDLQALKEIPALKKWKRLSDLDALPFTEQTIAGKINPKIPAIKYVLERKQTRRQYVQLGKDVEAGK